MATNQAIAEAWQYAVRGWHRQLLRLIVPIQFEIPPWRQWNREIGVVMGYHHHNPPSI
jgi:hypothetical protein